MSCEISRLAVSILFLCPTSRSADAVAQEALRYSLCSWSSIHGYKATIQTLSLESNRDALADR